MSTNIDALSGQQRIILALLIDPRNYVQEAAVEFDDTNKLVGHYIQVGSRHGLNPTSTFEAALYANGVLGIIESSQDSYVHYLFDRVGEPALSHALSDLSAADVAMMRDHFDADWYRTKYADLDWTVNDPFVHYISVGWRERRDPSSVFSTGSYLDLYADVRDCGINPFRHWVLDGIREGRSSGAACSPPLARLDSWETLSEGQKIILIRLFNLEFFWAGTEKPKGDVELSLTKHFDFGGLGLGDATPSFRAARYLAARPAVREAGQVPFLHYLFDAVGEDILRELFVVQPLLVLQAVCEQFDTEWYLYSYPDVELSGDDALIHFMTVGWKESRDPSDSFSTRAYLLRYPDIAEGGLNPFLHWIRDGQAEGRSAASSARNFRKRPYAPSITIVLVNTEADPITPDCVAAVIRQTYTNSSTIVVGAPLPEACIRAFDTSETKGAASAYRYLPNDGTLPLAMLLQCAVEQATGDLMWIVHGAGIHDSEFLARLTSSFADGSVQLGFGRALEPHDADYAVDEDELTRRMQNWTRHVTTPAALWFPAHLQPQLLASDRPSFLWRRRVLASEVWGRVGEYGSFGLWYLHLIMAAGGQIATVRDAIVRTSWAPAAMVRHDNGSLEQDVNRLTTDVHSFWSAPSIERPKRHILIVTHGIFAGGAENLPLQMANALAARGVIVSLLIFNIALNAEMRATLDPGVSIYEADWVLEYGCEQFLHDIGCSLIHSHGVVGEMFFFRLCEDALPVPYVATLHGSYEASSKKELPERFIAKIVRNVDLFIYTADKNLAPLLRNGVRPVQLMKMSNAMPVDETAFPRSRAELGISEDAIVFTLVARGIPEKGWSTAINAFKIVQESLPGRAMHLCLVGEGEEPERLKPLYADDPSITFLGFQLRIHGIYRMTDVAIVPTRFAGESYPLCVIQALQVAVPVIATDIGEIASMLKVDGVEGGVVITNSQIDVQFDFALADAMHHLMDDKHRQQLAAGAALLGQAYDMAAFTSQYIAHYDRVIQDFTESRAARLEPAANVVV